ncbi:MAG TPA: GNAT family N-acetyltransferase [Solirubrobacteraceae bacterium]
MIDSGCGLTNSDGAHTGPERERLRIEPVGELEDLDHSDWDRLARRSGNLFGTREWISTWWKVFASPGSLMSFTCRDGDGSLVALLPMYVCTGSPSRELRFLGHREADRLGPVCAPGHRPAVAEAMRQALYENRARFDVFVGDDLPEHERWGNAIGARSVRRTSSPVLRREGRSWQGFLSTQSPNFRQQARRLERRLARDHSLGYRLAEDPSRLDGDLDALLRLHEARWGGVSKAFLGKRATLHRVFAAKALERGWLRLWIAELDGRPAAAWYGFRYGDVEWYYQAGRDPRYDRLSIGFVLLAHTIRAALDDGVDEYRLLRGDERYKLRFANADAPVETVMLASHDLPPGESAGATAP